MNRGRVLTNPRDINLEREEILCLFREIFKKPGISQRELSVRLGISLGKINYLMKALMDKGFVKITKFKNSRQKSAYLYLLTPQGLEEKIRISCHFLARKTQEYEALKNEIRLLKSEIGSDGHRVEDLPGQQ